ncbi:MAG: hypothetical protein M3Z24_07500 [Chloroflexota bacterium]|nr:hypothetical protein [Chloroflexota bacterium]
MNDHTPLDGMLSPDAREAYRPLADWLQHIFVVPTDTLATPLTKTEHSVSEMVYEHEYHPQFYQKLPNFISALLANDPQVVTTYAPLLYHLVGCRICHTAYLELYDALSFALRTTDAQQPVDQPARALAALPASMLVHLCQLFISQAEAILQQGRHSHTATSIDFDASARSLLQQAMKISTAISQSGMRTRALKDLVRVATLFAGPSAPDEIPPATLAYTPTLVGSSGARRGQRVRRAGMAMPTENAIYLQFHHLEGKIVQDGHSLQLQLHDLEQALRGQYIQISIPLGSLIEPVRWFGGNPYAIRSTTPVDAQGNVTMPLGMTEMNLNNSEEHDLLEVMFSLVEVRPAL